MRKLVALLSLRQMRGRGSDQFAVLKRKVNIEDEWSRRCIGNVTIGSELAKKVSGPYETSVSATEGAWR